MKHGSDFAIVFPVWQQRSQKNLSSELVNGQMISHGNNKRLLLDLIIVMSAPNTPMGLHHRPRVGNGNGEAATLVVKECGKRG
jgi:hypothetical protein